MPAMMTTDFSDLSRDISKNLKLFTTAAHKMWADEWKNIIDQQKTDLKINKRTRYEGPGSAGEIAESGTAIQRRIYPGNVEDCVQNDYGAEIAISYQQRRFVGKDYQFMKNVSEYLVRSMKLVYENNAANVLNNGFSSSYAGYDTKAYFASDHTHRSDSSTYSNLLSSTDMGRQALKVAFRSMAEYKMEASVPAQLMPTRLHHSTEDLWTVPELLKTVQDPESANNTINVLKSEYNIKPNLNHYITDTDSYYIDAQNPSRVMMIDLPTEYSSYMQDNNKDLIEQGWCSQGTMFFEQANCFASQGG